MTCFYFDKPLSSDAKQTLKVKQNADAGMNLTDLKTANGIRGNLNLNSKL